MNCKGDKKRIRLISIKLWKKNCKLIKKLAVLIVKTLNYDLWLKKEKEIRIKRKSKINNNWIRGFDRIGSQKGRDGSRRKMILILVWLFWYVYIMEAYISIENSHTRTPHSATPASIQYIHIKATTLFVSLLWDLFIILLWWWFVRFNALCFSVLECLLLYKNRQYKLNEHAWLSSIWSVIACTSLFRSDLIELRDISNNIDQNHRKHFTKCRYLYVHNSAIAWKMCAWKKPMALFYGN